MLNWYPDAIWQVVDDNGAKDTVLFDQKAKSQKLTVVFEGNQKEATDYLLSHGGQGKAVVGATVTVGNNQVAVSGDYGTSTSRISGKSTSGDFGKVQAGENGTLILSYWDGKRMRIKTAYVGEKGILPNVAYKLDEKGKFVKAE